MGETSITAPSRNWKYNSAPSAMRQSALSARVMLEDNTITLQNLSVDQLG